MIDEVMPGMHRLEIPLPDNPLKAVNAYLIKGEERFLLIDAGMNLEQCASVMHSSLKTLGVDLNRTDFFITHLDVDHLGLAPGLAGSSSKIHIGRREAAMVKRIDDPQYFSLLANAFRENGFPEAELKRALPDEMWRGLGPNKPVNFETLDDGDHLAIGDYDFRCVETPGHTPGHMCLYEARKKLLISGDHILFDITPIITFWPDISDPLANYLQSLDKVSTLDVDLVLPGHRGFSGRLKERIGEIKAHHQARLNEIISALRSGDKDVYHIAPYVSWDVGDQPWKTLSLQQKWFSFAETLAHLQHLLAKGTVRQRRRNGGVVFGVR